MNPEPSNPTAPAWRRVFSPRRESGIPFRPGLTAFAALAIFTGFAGDFWRNLATWYGYGFIVLVLVVGSLWLLAKKRPLPRLAHLPAPLVLFVVWCSASVIWSAYRPETLLGSAGQIATAIIALGLAITLTKPQFVRALSLAMRWILGLSLAFEVVVALFFPGGVLPLSYTLMPGLLETVSGVPDATRETVPAGYLWSQGNIFNGSAIQGIVGNRNLLAMVALLCVTVVAVQWAAGQMRRWPAVVWIGLGLVTIGLCRSMTVVVAVSFVAFAFLLIRIARPLTNPQRWLMYAVVGSAMVVGLVLVYMFRDDLFGLINRSSDMSGRGDIWAEVAQLARENWLVGLGWVSYWAPWVEPFKGLLVIDGVQFLQAHNAYLDTWMQTGIIGAVLFGGLVLSTLIRTWWLAIDRPQTDASGPRDIPHTSTLAFLVMVALAVQSMTESRLLIEGNWLLLSYFAIYSKLRVQDLPALPRRTLAAHTGPIGALNGAPGRE